MAKKEGDLSIISLGAGAQSTVMALMAAQGDIKPMPDAAIFADTGWEPPKIIKHLDWLWKQLPFPVYIVGRGNIKKDHLKGLNTTGKRFASMPLYVSGGGMGRRQCTREYKIEPIERLIRRWFLGLKPKQHAPKDIRVIQWIGITTDEASRMKDSRTKFIRHRWPLIELNLTREDCLRWFQSKYNRNLEKSACVGCPYTDDKRWREIKIKSPAVFADAVEFDKSIRQNGSTLRGMKEQQFVHRSCVPLDEVDFRNLEDMGQANMFINECEGMCGV